jgi:hypothetical protein
MTRKSPWYSTSKVEIPKDIDGFRHTISDYELARIQAVLMEVAKGDAERGFYILIAAIMAMASANNLSRKELIEALTEEINACKEVKR